MSTKMCKTLVCLSCGNESSEAKDNSLLWLREGCGPAQQERPAERLHILLHSPRVPHLSVTIYETVSRVRIEPNSSVSVTQPAAAAAAVHC